MTITHSKTRPSSSAHVGTALHFPWRKVSTAIAEARAADTVRSLYGHDTGKGLWLVGDEGVYLMPNTTGSKRTIVYARECDPTKLEFDTWWESKRATFGGDDGIEFISIEEIESLVAAPPKPGLSPRYLVIAMMPEQRTLSVLWSANRH
jgi:hypothetical protein